MLTTVQPITNQIFHVSSVTRPASFHVVIPASQEDPNLCKVLLSAAVLGYPSPVIINWHKEFDDETLVAGGSHLAKISGIHEFVVSLDSTHDEDLVLMVDGFDVWFQLRPQVLIDRYFDINRRADERIRAELGAEVAMKHGVRQEIVFGCQKRCWPWTEDDPPCYAMPESTLPADVYGPETDTDVGNKENPYIKYRQRYLNSGVGIGTVRAMRKLFGQALALAQAERNFGSDQYIFSHIFGDQEVWRNVLQREEGSRSYRSDHSSRGKKYPEKHLEEVRAKAKARSDKNYEFGIGVDYESLIGLNTVFAEDDTEWLSFNDTANLREVQQTRGIDPAEGRLSALDSDIAASVPPFWTFSHEPSLPRWLQWSEITLFTNVWTGITPAIIHHNAHRDGMKSLRTTWWEKSKVFYLEFARTLLDAYIYAPLTALAHSGYDTSSMREWWPYEIWKGGARNGNASVGSAGDGNWIRFDTICRDFSGEVFRDGKGAWELPAIH